MKSSPSAIVIIFSEQAFRSIFLCACKVKFVPGKKKKKTLGSFNTVFWKFAGVRSRRKNEKARTPNEANYGHVPCSLQRSPHCQTKGILMKGHSVFYDILVFHLITSFLHLFSFGNRSYQFQFQNCS